MKAKLIKTENGYGLEGCGLIAFVSSRRPVHKHYKLSLENCQAIECGYNLGEFVDGAFDNMGYHSTVTPHEEKQFKLGYKLGFQKALELMSDKKFSESDVLDHLNHLIMMPSSKLDEFTDDDEMVTDKWFDQSLQRKAWDVEIEMEKVESYKDKMGNVRTEKTFPKLDSDGCLILTSKPE